MINRLIKTIFVLVAAVATSSCMSDFDLPTPTPGGNEALVKFNLRTPAPASPGTRAVDESFENSINNIVLLVAGSDGGGGFNVKRMIRVDGFTQTTNTTATFTVSLMSDPTPTKLMIITNLAQGMYNTLDAFQYPVSENDVRAQLSDTFLYSIYGSPKVMTMTGAVTLSGGISPEQTINVDIPLMRMTARVDVRRNLTVNSRSFEPTAVYVRRAQTHSQVFPDLSALDPADPARVVRASLPDPDNSSSNYNYPIDAVDSSTGLFHTVYVPESVNQDSPFGQLNYAMCLVVAGRYNGSGSESYYRVDFNSGIEGHPFGQVLRNYRYVFDITSVTSAGYGSIEEALANPSTAMRVNVSQWNELYDGFSFVDPSVRKINVLSLGSGAGTMGTWYEGGEVSDGAAQFRQMLTNSSWFGPGGTVDFAGFTFDQFTDGNVTASTPANIDRLTRALTSTDILIVPYACNPDQQTTDLILRWLSDPHHVMFLSCDAGMDNTPGEATNVILRGNLDNSMAWHSVGNLGNQTLIGGVLGNIINIFMGPFGLGATANTNVDGAMAADSSDANTPFTNGPFGVADTSQMGHGNDNYRMWDQTGEWATPSDGSSFVPLMVFQVTITATVFGIAIGTHVEKTNLSLMGVDPQRRVVYLGKTEFVDDYLRSVPSNPVGDPLTPRYNSITTLMCNTWAWAVRTVLGD